MSNIICQLYGFRKEIEKDPYLCFQKIRAIGFKEVQLDGLRNRTKEEIKDALDQNNLKVSSMHIKHLRFIFDLQGIIDDCNYFNCQEVYLKYIEDEFQVEYGYKFTKHCLIKASLLLAKHGIKVGFHSPEYDFNTLIDNQKVMDYICDSDEAEIFLEPDTYWLSVAGIDPLKYISQYPNRILTIHFKDIDTSKDLMDMKNNLTECGQGDVDFKKIYLWAIKNGVKKFAIEQDYAKQDIYESFKISYQYLINLEKELKD